MGTLLIIDDEMDLLEIIEMELEMAGFDVIKADGLGQAKEKIVEGGFDGVLTDYRMPDGTGSDVLLFLQQQKVDVPCFIISGFSDISPERAYDLGAWGYFNKPTNLKLVTEVIEKSLKPTKERFTTLPPEESSKQVFSLEANSYHEAKGQGQLRIEKGGFYFLCELNDLKREDHITFEFKLGDGVLKGQGIIRWIHSQEEKNKHYLGIEFLYLDEASFILYEKIIEDSTVPSIFIPMHPAA